MKEPHNSLQIPIFSQTIPLDISTTRSRTVLKDATHTQCKHLRNHQYRLQACQKNPALSQKSPGIFQKSPWFSHHIQGLSSKSPCSMSVSPASLDKYTVRDSYTHLSTCIRSWLTWNMSVWPPPNKDTYTVRGSYGFVTHLHSWWPRLISYLNPLQMQTRMRVVTQIYSLWLVHVDELHHIYNMTTSPRKVDTYTVCASYVFLMTCVYSWWPWFVSHLQHDHLPTEYSSHNLFLQPWTACVSAFVAAFVSWCI